MGTYVALFMDTLHTVAGPVIQRTTMLSLIVVAPRTRYERSMDGKYFVTRVSVAILHLRGTVAFG